jgi:hypothetical protein
MRVMEKSHHPNPPLQPLVDYTSGILRQEKLLKKRIKNMHVQREIDILRMMICSSAMLHHLYLAIQFVVGCKILMQKKIK